MRLRLFMNRISKLVKHIPFILLFSLSLALPPSLQGQDTVISTNPSVYNNSPFHITEILSDSPIDTQWEISLTSVVAGTATVDITNLDTGVDESGQIVIEPSMLTFPRSVIFSGANDTQTLIVRLNDVVFPGVYNLTVSLEFTVNSEEDKSEINGKETTKEIELKAAFYMKPNIEIEPSSVTQNWVACDYRLTCEIAEAVINGGSIRDFSLLVTNSSQAKIEVLETNTTLLPENGNGNIIEMESGSVTVDVNDDQVLRIVRSDNYALIPGTYTGSINVRAFKAGEPRLRREVLDGSASYIDMAEETISTTVNVRSGPTFPIILILLGILAGRAVQVMSNEKTKNQIDLFSRYRKLESLADQLTDPDTKLHTHKLLFEVYSAIDDFAKSYEQIKKMIDERFYQLRMFIDLETYLSRIRNIEDDQLKQELIELTDETIRHIYENDLVTAKSLLHRIHLKFNEDNQLPASDKETLSPNDLQPSASLDKTIPTDPISGILATLSGDKYYTPVHIKYHVWRPVLFIFLIITLVFQGLVLNYGGDANATFGSGGLVDYVGLLLWGLGTDVATRTLQQISLARSS